MTKKENKVPVTSISLFSLIFEKPSFNSLTYNEMLDFSKFAVFADHNLNVAKVAKFFCDREENIVGKGQNAGC